MAKKKSVKVVCESPIKLNDEGYGELMGLIQEAIGAEGDEVYEVKGVTLDVRPLEESDASTEDTQHAE